jgi:Lysozyme like domain
MAKLSDQEIAQLAANAGFGGPDLETAIAVSLAESWEGDPNAIGDKIIQTAEYGPSVGLWQIRSINPGHGGWFDKQHRVYQDNFDPQTNANNAYAIWDRYGWDQWSTYTHGDYKKYLDRARAAAGTVSPPLPAKRSETIPPLPEKRSDAGGSGGNGMSATLQELAGSLPKFLQSSNRLGNVAKQAQQTVARGGAFGDVPGSQVAQQGNQRNAGRSAEQANGARDRVDKVRDGVKDSGDKYEQYDQDQGQQQGQERIQIDNAYDPYRNYA